MLEVNLADRELSHQAERLLARLLPRPSDALSRLLFYELPLPLPELPLRLRWRPAQVVLEAQTALHLLFDVAVELQDSSRPDPARAEQLRRWAGRCPAAHQGPGQGQRLARARSSLLRWQRRCALPSRAGNSSKT